MPSSEQERRIGDRRVVLNSHLFAGFVGNELGIGTFDLLGVISNFRTKAKVDGFANSSVISGTIKTVTLASVKGDNGGTDKFGIYAHFFIKSVIIGDPKKTYKQPTADGFDDFQVEVV